MTMRTTPKRPPAVAVWLFEHFACGSNTNAVLGDLAEQYVHKSRMWYWRQVLKGIPVSVATQALGHKVIAAKAVVAGCIAWFVFLVLYPGFVFGFVADLGPSFDLVGYLGHPLFALGRPVDSGRHLTVVPERFDGLSALDSSGFTARGMDRLWLDRDASGHRSHASRSGAAVRRFHSSAESGVRGTRSDGLP